MLNNPKPDGMTRREWLAIVGAGSAAGLAGCTGGDGGDGGGDGGDGGGDGGDGGDGGGGGGTPDPADLPPVHFLTDYNNEPWQAYWEDDLIPAFTDATGIDVDIEYSGMSGQQEGRLATLVQAGDPPAINTSTFDQVADLWAADQLETTTSVTDQVESVAGDMLATPFNQNGDIWEVPHGYYTSNFHYRTDIYDELGLDVPETFQEVMDNAQAIDEADMGIRGYGLAGQKTGKSQDEFQVYLANMGTSGIGLRWADPDAQDEVEIHFPEEEVVTLLEYFQELAQYSPDPTGLGWATSIQNYLGGQFAQQYHLNTWPAGIAGSAGVTPIAENTEVAPLPRWEAGGITKDDVWLYEPTPDGHHVFSQSENPAGAKEFLAWLYGDSIDRTASMYHTEPTRFLPDYADVLASDTYQGFSHWQDWPNHLEQLEYTQNTIVGDYYGNVPESDLSGSAVAVYVTRQWFYGEMINLVVTGQNTPQEAYDWGYGRLETRVQEGRERFGG